MCSYSKIVPTLTNIRSISNSVLTVIYTFDANEGALDLNKKKVIVKNPVVISLFGDNTSKIFLRKQHWVFPVGLS